MVTCITESDNLNVRTQLDVTIKCRTYEDFGYNHEDGNSLRFEMNEKSFDLENDLNSDLQWFKENLDSVSDIKFVSAEVKEAEFEDEDDYTSGVVNIRVEMLTDTAPSDYDLEYVSECITESLSDMVEARVYGEETYLEDYVDYSRDGYVGQREHTIEVDRKVSISNVPEEMSWQKVMNK